MDHSSRRISPNEVVTRKSKFAIIEKVEDTARSQVKEDTKVVEIGLGEVLVAAYRTRDSERPISTSAPLREAPSQIAEKALKGKALSHGVGRVVTKSFN